MEILKTERSVKEAFTPRVAAETWNNLGDEGQRRYLADAAEANSARMEAVREEEGTIRVTSRGVAKFRLLLDPTMFREGEPLAIVWNGRARPKQPKASARLLLEDYLERVDPSFLPVAEVVLP